MKHLTPTRPSARMAAACLLACALVLCGGAVHASTPAPAPMQGGNCSPAWIPTFGLNGVDGTVLAAVLFDDGSGKGAELYVGGDFGLAGRVPAGNVAKWDGTRWSALGAGTDGAVRALAVYDDGLGGGPALYAGGDFTSAGGAPAAHLARWDGASWSPVGGGTNGSVRCLIVHPNVYTGTDELYVGGAFTSAGSSTGPFLARWNGSTWPALPGVFDGPVNAMLSARLWHGMPDLIVGGEFLTIDGFQAPHLARLQTTAWFPVGLGTDGPVRALALYEEHGPGLASLYVGGDFTRVGGIHSPHLARWVNPGIWQPLDIAPPDGAVRALAVHAPFGPPLLYAGGDFQLFGGISSPHLVAWDGFVWIAQPSSPAAPVRALVSSDTDSGGLTPGLYFAGEFERVELPSPSLGFWTRGIARLEGSEIGILGSAVQTTVTALAVHDDGSGNGLELYASGSRFLFGDRGRFGDVRTAIARWDGESWSPLGAGLEWEANALVTHDDGSGPALYAGGWFDTAGDLPAQRVARWDGSSWSALGAGLSGVVLSLCSYEPGNGSGELLYAGMSGGGLRVWNGSGWGTTAIGSGMTVSSLLVAPDTQGGGPVLYAGGSFTTVGLLQALCVAAWNGTAWSSLGLGVDGHCYALAWFDDGSGVGPALYAAGNFLAAFNSPTEGLAVNRIARWNGASWSAVGDGFNNLVRSLVVHDDGTGAGPALYAGGEFTASGATAVSRVARWNGSSWAPLDAGVGPYVHRMLSHDDGAGPTLFAGGYLGSSQTGSSDIASWVGCADAPPPCDPSAAFSGAPTSGVAPLTVSFTDLSSGGPTSWSWTFGDGGSSSAQHPSHTYTQAGTYPVGLTVSNACGSDELTLSGYVTVSAPPTSMRVADIVVVRENLPQGYKRGVATVTIEDATGSPVSGAVVTGDFSAVTGGFSGKTTETGLVGTTDSNGRVVFGSIPAKGGGEWCFEVTNVTHATLTYSPGDNAVTRSCESGDVF